MAPPRYVLFGGLCAAWLAAMVLFANAATLRAAGLAWFTTWGIQIVVAVTSWMRPFSLPARYYLPLITPGPWRVPRVLGVGLFGRIATRINPFRYDRGCPHDLEAAIDAAETTHIVTFVIVVILALAFAVLGSMALVFFLTLWNVLFNLYPIALQRHNRARVRQVARRRARRHAHDAIS